MTETTKKINFEIKKIDLERIDFDTSNMHIRAHELEMNVPGVSDEQLHEHFETIAKFLNIDLHKPADFVPLTRVESRKTALSNLKEQLDYFRERPNGLTELITFVYEFFVKSASLDQQWAITYFLGAKRPKEKRVFSVPSYLEVQDLGGRDL